MVGNNNSGDCIKLLCSYGGRILPRHPDGKLRYKGGETRVLAVPRFISFSELWMKLGEMCGGVVSVRCQLPTDDLDALVSITSDEDLANVIQEYDRAPASSLKIRVFLVRKPKTPPAGFPQNLIPQPEGVKCHRLPACLLPSPAIHIKINPSEVDAQISS